MSKLMAGILCVLSGALAAILAILFMQALFPARELPTRVGATSSSPTLQIASLPNASNAPAATKIEKIANSFEMASPSAPSASSSQSFERTSRPSPEELELIREEDLAIQQRRYADHDREARDTSWAFQMEAQLQESLQAAFSPSTRFENADCRTHTCTVVITWPSMKEARDEMMGIAATTPCASSLSAPTPMNGEFRSTLWLNCAPSSTPSPDNHS